MESGGVWRGGRTRNGKCSYCCGFNWVLAGTKSDWVNLRATLALADGKAKKRQMRKEPGGPVGSWW